MFPLLLPGMLTDKTINNGNCWINVHNPLRFVTRLSRGAPSVGSFLRDGRRAKVSESCSDENFHTRGRQAPPSPTSPDGGRLEAGPRAGRRPAGRCRYRGEERELHLTFVTLTLPSHSRNQ